MQEKKFTLAQNSLFNMVGTFIYYICQWGITILVVWLSTDQNIGRLQLSMTVSNIFVSFAHFNMSAYQISDVYDEYKSAHYVALRLFTCGIAFLLCVGYSAMWGYSINSICCIALYLFYRLIENFALVFFMVDLKHARMDHVLISYSLKGLLMIAAFAAAIIITDDIMIAIVSMSVVTLAVLLLYDVPCAGRYDSIRPIFDWGKMKKMLITCFPTMLGAVLFTAIVTIPRQNLGKIMGQDLLGYYATVATPLVFVQVLVDSLMTPSIKELSLCKKNHKKKYFKKIIGKLMLFILGISITAILGVKLLGQPVMTILYGQKIIPYIPLMFAVIGCTVTYAICSVCFNLLIVLRKMTTYLVLCALALMVDVLLSDAMIQHYGADGVSYSVLISYVCAAFASFIVIFLNVRAWDEKGRVMQNK